MCVSFWLAVIFAHAQECQEWEGRIGVPNEINVAVKNNERNLIVNGGAVGTGEYPWQAMFVDFQGMGLICGGSLISRNKVLTAHHCVLTYPLVPRNFMMENVAVCIGIFRWDGATQRNICENLFEIKGYTLYPYYDNTAGDIAIIELKDDVPCDNENIRPIGLMSGNFALDGCSGFVTGMGRSMTESNVEAPKGTKPPEGCTCVSVIHPNPQWGRIPAKCVDMAFSNGISGINGYTCYVEGDCEGKQPSLSIQGAYWAVCTNNEAMTIQGLTLEVNTKLHRDYYGVITKGNGKMTEGACFGDSGGPLIIDIDESTTSNRYVQVGVVSYGLSYTMEDPSVTPLCEGDAIYMDVSRYVDWIVSKTDNMATAVCVDRCDMNWHAEGKRDSPTQSAQHYKYQNDIMCDKSDVPPMGCTCKEQTIAFNATLSYDFPARCDSYYFFETVWCFVQDERSCREKVLISDVNQYAVECSKATPLSGLETFVVSGSASIGLFMVFTVLLCLHIN